MKRRIGVAFVVFATCSALTLSAVGAGSQPNIIYILADDLGIGDLGVTNQLARAQNGLPAISTPNIDALANQGMTFNRMYTGAPICSPSRASLLTGFDMVHVIKEHTDQRNGFRAGQEDKTWGQMFQDAGYKTGMFGKWHLGGVDSPGIGVVPHTPHAIPTQKGFETAFGSMQGGYRSQFLWENDGTGGLKLTLVQYTPEWPGPGLPFRYSQEVTSDHVVQFVRDNALSGQPFAAYVPFEAPHEPFDRVDGGQYANQPWPEVQKRYANMISGLDRNVGEIVAAVEDPNHDGDKSDSIASNTIIIFASDNGPLWTPHSSGFVTEFFDSNGPYRGIKSDTAEAGIRTPFFVRWDGVTAPGSVNNDYVGSFADIYPTFAELTGQDTPFGQDGTSMLSAITGEGRAPQRDAMVWTSKDSFTGLNQASWAIQMGDWKLIRRMSNFAFELFHISSDPYETQNLAATRPDIKNALEQVMQLEGVLEEPYFQNASTAGGLNVYYTQYKYWSPQGGNTAFGLAESWAGGQQFNREGEPESKYWNTGPANNWLASVNNDVGGFRNAFVLTDSQVLAMQVNGTAGIMRVTVNPGVSLEAYNGVRISDQGIVRLLGGTMKTVREIDVRAGGKLEGAGLITGYQQIVDSVPEFQGKNLLEPEVWNSGLVDIYKDAGAGVLTIDGNFSQSAIGTIDFDLFGGGGVGGFDFDKLSITGTAELAGSVNVDLMGGYVPTLGQSFAVLSAANIVADGLHLVGPYAPLFTLSLQGQNSLVLTFVVSGDFDGNNIVDGNDLIAWEQAYAQQNPEVGDADGDADADGADFLVWQRQIHANPATPLGVPTPEPSTWALVALLTIVGGVTRPDGCRWQRKQEKFR